jgi:Na+-driven multidrug efflux pump
MNSIFFQAVGKPGFAVISSTLRDMMCFVPLMLILPLISPDVELLLYSAPISDLIAILVTAILSLVFLRSLKADGSKKKRKQKGDAVCPK